MRQVSLEPLYNQNKNLHEQSAFTLRALQAGKRNYYKSKEKLYFAIFK